MLNRFMLPLALLMVAAPTAGADLFRTIDENGNVVFTDRPVAQGTAELLDVKSARTDNLRVAERRQAKLEGRQNELRSEEEAAEQAEKQQANQARSDENCRRAREALASLISAQRLFVTNDNGERAYLDDEQRNARIARGEADVAEWCNGTAR
jgi:hypothetical protein